MSPFFTPFDAKALRLAQYYLTKGELVAFPTETVYALAADATSDIAVASIYHAKQRQKDKPLSLLVKDVAQIRELCQMDARAETLLRHFSPGPLTLVLPLKTGHRLSRLINPGQDTIGVRIPDHPVAQAILRAVDVPIVGTSANLSGQGAAICAETLRDTIGQALALVIDGGTSSIGIASTVVDMTASSPTLLRKGSVSLAQIQIVIA